MQHQAFIILLSKRLSGEITPEQQEQLNQWLAQDIEHQRMADAYQFIWDKAEHISFEESLSPNLDQAFNKVMQYPAAQPVAAPTIFGVSRGFLVRAAAAISILAVVLWGLQLRLSTNQQQDFVEITAQQGEKTKVSLPDGSTVWLRSGSTLRYPREFGKDSRCVELFGEAFFEVSHNPQAPFCATTSRNERVEVLGTSFDIKESENATTVLVKTGKVRFSTPNNATQTIVTAGRVVNYDRPAAKVTLRDAPSFNEIAWQMGHLEFMDTPVEQVVKDFEKHFNIKIQLENNELLQCRYTSTQVPADVEKALEAFSSTFKLDLINLSSNDYTLKGGSCL